MRLEKFDKNKRIKRMIITSCIGIILIVGGITLYKTFAFYEEEKSFNILKGKVPEFSKSDITLAFTIDGNPTTDKFPNKSDGYVVKSVTCENGVTAEWNNSKWGIVNIVNTNNKKIKCSIDFKTATFADFLTTCDNATTCLVENADKNTEELAFDGTVDNNLRYIGANPNNYVNFNCKEVDGTRTCELWRIIGVMNNVPNSTGKKATRIKLIRSEDLGEMAWDTAATNNWETSSLKIYLNGDYYNSLTDEAKSMISNITWNLGGHDTESAIASTFYKAERGETTYNNYPTKGIGYIGLMYPSDFGFAVGGSVRSTCLSTNLESYNNNKCYTNDWLYKTGKYQWTLSTLTIADGQVFEINPRGLLSITIAPQTMFVPSPVVYLNSEIKIKSGSGTSSSPFELSLF